MTTKTTDKVTVENQEQGQAEHREIDIRQTARDIDRSLHQITYDLGYMKGQQDVIGWAWLAAGIGMFIMLLIQITGKLIAR